MSEWVLIPETNYYISNTGMVINQSGKALKQYPPRMIRDPRYHRSQRFRGEYVKINGRIRYISDLMCANAPDSTISGIIWSPSNYVRHLTGV